MKHRLNSAKTDTSDPTIVGSSAWNDTHVVGITALSANTTLNTTHDYIKAVGGTLGITLTLPAAVLGLRYEIKKVDAAAGVVTITGGSIDGQSSFVLSNQWQSVTLNCDGMSWHVVARVG